MYVRDVQEADAAGVTMLLEVLGYPQTVQAVRERIAALPTASDRAWVAIDDDAVLGVVSLHVLPMFHAPHALGKITALAVSPTAQGRGIGRQLLRQAEAWALRAGATRMEIISGNHRPEAHAFYRHLQYSATQQRRFLRHLTDHV